VCLDVQGNRAGFVWQVEETSDQSFQGLYEHFSVRDNGPPGKGVPDMVVSAPNTPVLPPSCPPITETVPALKGNIVVHDSTPGRFRRHTRRPPAGRRPVALRRGDKCLEMFWKQLVAVRGKRLAVARRENAIVLAN